MKFLFPALIVFASACQNTPTSPSLPATFTLEPGQSARGSTVLVRFMKVVSDSRCPLNAMCVSAGDAVATFRMTAGGLDGEYELALNDASKRTVTHRGFTLEFQALQPYPVAGQPTNPADYRATVEIRQ